MEFAPPDCDGTHVVSGSGGQKEIIYEFVFVWTIQANKAKEKDLSMLC